MRWRWRKIRRVQAAGRLSVAMRTIIEDTSAARKTMWPGYGAEFADPFLAAYGVALRDVWTTQRPTSPPRTWSGTPPRASAEPLLAARALHGFRDRTLREDAAEVRLVLDRPLKVGLHVDALRALLCRRLDRCCVELLADESRLDALGPDGLRAGAGDRHARLHAPALLVERHHGGGADEGEPGGRIGALHVGAAAARRPHGHAHLDENLVLAYGAGHQALEPVVHLHRAPALRPLADELDTEREDGRRLIGGWIGVSQRAADRPEVPDGRITDHGRCFGQGRALRLDQG